MLLMLAVTGAPSQLWDGMRGGGGGGGGIVDLMYQCAQCQELDSTEGSRQRGTGSRLLQGPHI